MQTVIEDRVWTDFCDLNIAGIPMGRRVTVIRSKAGGVFVWSPLPAVSINIENIRELSDDVTFILQSKMHNLYINDYQEYFPNSRFLAANEEYDKNSQYEMFSSCKPLEEEFYYVEVAGMPKVKEVVFYHIETKTLIVADLFFNVSTPKSGFRRFLCSVAGIGDKPKSSRLWKSMIKDADEYCASLKAILEWDIDRIITGHGNCVNSGAKDVLEEILSEYTNR